MWQQVEKKYNATNQPNEEKNEVKDPVFFQPFNSR